MVVLFNHVDCFYFILENLLFQEAFFNIIFYSGLSLF